MLNPDLQIRSLIKRLKHVRQGFKHDLADQKRSLRKARNQVQHNFTRQSRRFEDWSHEQQPSGGLAVSLGLLVLGGVGFWAYRNLRKVHNRDSLQSAPGVDLSRFCGKWFEIAHFPGKHEDVAGMTLTYTLQPDNSLDVLLSYHDHDLSGPEHTQRKHIWIAEPDNRSHLKKQVIGPIGTDYWILEIGKNYEYAVLGTPSRKHLWILSRTPKLEASCYESIVERMQEQGFDTSKLLMVPQDEHAPVALSSHLQGLLEHKQQYFKGKEHDKHMGPKGEKRPEKRPDKHPEQREGI
ncbi:MAG: hypothetical protein CVV27_14740 [Candidatus Melainabacteria bacterium HGW-Melainabacteria-1]|nr:MAG: hypothetical protein CVV27_14740 [Candidatus Melainabacteria bacterium HGW-Melainabacteria-1]